jgi:hypothetical protein
MSSLSTVKLNEWQHENQEQSSIITSWRSEPHGVAAGEPVLGGQVADRPKSNIGY